MKRALILTKRNCGDAIRLQAYINKAYNWKADMSTENANASHSLQYCIPDYDVIWMYYYPHIIKKEVLDLNDKWLNTHPSYLPHNRGSAPNFFCIVLNNQAGATVHKVTERLDDGDILALGKVYVSPVDDGETVYKKLQKEAFELSVRVFDEIMDSLQDWYKIGHRVSVPPESSANKMDDFHLLRNLDKVWSQTGDLKFIMRIIRAATFSGYEGAYFRDEQGRKIEIKGRFKEIG